MQQITAPLRSFSEDPVGEAAETGFPTVLRGYDKFAVDAYVRHTSQMLAELQSRSTPQAAVRRALERVGEDVSGILQRAHETAEAITIQSRREAEERLEVSRREAAEVTALARARVKELDADTDRIWSERDRIVADARDLARQLLELADEAAARFPADEETGETPLVAPAAPDDTAETVDSLPRSPGEPIGTEAGGLADAEGFRDPGEPLVAEDEAGSEPQLVAPERRSELSDPSEPADSSEAADPAETADPAEAANPAEPDDQAGSEAEATQAFPAVAPRAHDQDTQGFEPFDVDTEGGQPLPGELRFTRGPGPGGPARQAGPWGRGA